MPLIFRLVFRAAFAMSVVAMMLPSLAIADEDASGERAWPAANQTVGISPSSRTEVVRGVVASVDERNDTVKIQRSPEMTEELKVQDGLLFNSVLSGDQVEVTIEKIDGIPTVVGLTKP